MKDEGVGRGEGYLIERLVVLDEGFVVFTIFFDVITYFCSVRKMKGRITFHLVCYRPEGILDLKARDGSKG